MRLDRALLGDVYAARATLEAAAVRMLARRRRADELLALDSYVTSLEQLTRSASGPKDVAAWNDGALRFHESIVSYAGNQTVALLVAGLRDVIIGPLARTERERLDTAVDLSSADFARAVRSFRKLVRLLADRDGERAEAHWAEHMHTATRIMLDSAVDDATVRALLV